jgi:pyridoxine 4-dehydrogenase
VLRVADELGVLTLAYSPLAQGILTGKFDEREVINVKKPTGPRSNGWGAGGDLASTLPKVRKLLVVMREIADLRGKTVGQIALNWCICKGTVPIPGARNPAQARDNCGALGWNLEAEEVYRLDIASRESGVELPLQLQNIPSF